AQGAGGSSDDYAIPSDVFSGGGEPAGSTDYDSNASIGQPGTIGVSQSADYTLHAGFWNAVAGGSPACVHHGDVNFSGGLTAADAQMVFNIVLGLITPTFEEECAADCNNSGSITAGDSQTIFYAVLGIGSGCVDPIN
ncbi:MAG TPA: dockerin type I repeat-containing protein, partial [bacterium]|nr:dockerin type I repeat-containing protein [bacterium]